MNYYYRYCIQLQKVIVLEVVSYVKLFSVQQGGGGGSCISPKTELIRKKRALFTQQCALSPFAFISKQLKVGSLKHATVRS